MNLLELKQQAGIQDNPDQEGLDLFAELIVQKCIRIVAKRKDQAIDDGYNVDEAMSVAEMDLLEYFGVEE